MNTDSQATLYMGRGHSRLYRALPGYDLLEVGRHTYQVIKCFWCKYCGGAACSHCKWTGHASRKKVEFKEARI